MAKKTHPLQSPEAIRRWQQISGHVIRERVNKRFDAASDLLRHLIKEEKSEFFGPLYELWVGDNLQQDCRFEEAAEVYERVTKEYGDRLFPMQMVGRAGALSLESAATCYERLADPARAIDAIERLLKSYVGGVSKAWLYYRIGTVAEDAGDYKRAIEAFRKAEKSKDAPSYLDWEVPDIAARAAMRLEKGGKFARSAEELAAELARAFRKGDSGRLAELASPTHFAVGIAMSERDYVDPKKFLAVLASDLKQSKVRTDAAALEGSGEKIYLWTDGWDGEFFVGRIAMLMTRHREGWEWGGVILTRPGKRYQELIPPAEPQKNQPLELAIRAPWASGQCWRAGGLNRFLESFIPFVGWVIAAEDTFSSCGYGPGGFYYNEPISHNGASAFAIDFTRYQTGVPFVNTGGNQQVLAVAEGMVNFVRSHVASGSASTDNRVEIAHWTPAEPLRCGGPTHRYLSKYLHLAGPSQIPVSTFMWAEQGTRLGLTDDTGNSAFAHLHFSMHDRNIMFNGAPYGSTRPTPMDGQTLNDNNGGRCVCSSNVPRP